MNPKFGPSKPKPRPPRTAVALRINLEDSGQCRWWAEHFGVSPAELFAAILRVGVDASAVRQALDDK